ncbi:uncharacterized protein TNCV_2837861 [Trichonephila clavipes]|nr:uncharacterized protein TNCV_2837861 [Trichonephila clavipes]
MSEKALVYHIFVRLEPQVQDFVEVRNPQNMVQLLKVLAKFEERYSGKAMRGSRNSDNVEGRGWNERRMSNVDNNRGNWRNSEVVRRPNNGRNDYRDGSKIILDFDRKSLAIPDSQIDKVVKTVVVEKVEIDLSKTKLEEKHKRELQYLFDSFQG